jgi:hypothetical protein
MAPLIGILINLLILCVILAIVYWIASAIIAEIGGRFAPLAQKVLVVICLLILLLWFLSALQGGPMFYQYGSGPLLRGN